MEKKGAIKQKKKGHKYFTMIFKKINKVAISLKEYYRIEMPDFKEVIARKQEKINCELAEL